MLHWSFFLVLLGTVAQNSAAVNIRTMCAGYPSGTLLPNPQDCNSYYVCQSGPQLAYCDYGLHFDRVNKVCNWPDWANCKLEEVSFDNLVAEPSQSKEESIKATSSGDESVEKKEELNALDIPAKQEIPKLIIEITNLKPEKDSVEVVQKPDVQTSNSTKNSTQTIKVPVVVPAEIPNFETPNASKPVSNSTHVIQVPVVVPAEIPHFETEIPSAETPNASKPVSNSTHVIQVPVVVPAEIPRFETEIPSAETPNASKPVSNSTHVIQVPVVVPAEIPKFETEIPSAETPNASKPVSNSTHVIQVPVVVPAEIPHFETSNGSKPLKNSTHTLQVQVVVSAEIPSSIASSSVGEIVEKKEESLKPSKNQSHVIETSVPVVSGKPNKGNQEAQVVVEKVESSLPSKQQGQVVELPVTVLPVEVAVSNANASVSLSQAVVEKVNSSKQLENSSQVIELSVPALPEEVRNPANVIPQSDPTVEKAESQKTSQNSGQVIELSVPALPEEVLNPANVIPQSDPAVEKVESQKPSQNSNQVIELPVPALPVEVFYAANVTSQSGPIVEKVESQKPSQNSNQAIELPAPALLVKLPDATKVISQAEAVVEKAESPKSPQNLNQVIELPVASFPVVKPNTSVTNSTPSQAEVVVGKLDKPSDSKLPLFSGPEMIKPVAHPEVQIGGNSHSKKGHQDLIQSSESIQLSEESQSRESSEENSADKKVEEASESESGEGDHAHDIEKVELIDSQPESYESSEESLALLQGQKVSIDLSQSSKQNTIELSHRPSQEVDSLSSEEDFLRPNHHHHPHHAIKGNPDSSDEDASHFHHQTNNSKKVAKPVDVGLNKESLPKADVDILSHLLKPQAAEKPSDLHIVALNSLAPIGKPIATQGEAALSKVNSNLIVSVLSVASSKGNSSANGTINRPIVGAHNTETGHPIDVMAGYSSKNVQCIHNGLYFLPHPSSCQKYFICAYHHLHLHSCGNNLTWNYKREQCEMESGARCYSEEKLVVASPRPEKPLKPARENTTQTVVSETEEPLASTPMPPLRTTSSVPATISRDSTLPKCPAIRQIYLPSLDDCNKYYICIMGQAVLTSCPDNMHWDGKGEFCGHPTEVLCAGG